MRKTIVLLSLLAASLSACAGGSFGSAAKLTATYTPHIVTTRGAAPCDQKACLVGLGLDLQVTNRSALSLRVATDTFNVLARHSQVSGQAVATLEAGGSTYTSNCAERQLAPGESTSCRVYFRMDALQPAEGEQVYAQYYDRQQGTASELVLAGLAQ
ncbi:hypothetical protein HNR42_000041 [Deinobacterium chartae]|uniref:Lipoprotein n=1 Tax=Deinobacterium chartae TaxID=521158 RepID=A0A841HWK4_9DEIO|nr:hypothetical protein [Deinobacterium chartae]MBB6096629.1 hypothetical protein [Deinobacterium chartae]